MKISRKTLLLLSSLSFFIFSGKKSFAQFPGMGAVRAQQNQQFMNQQMQMQMAQMLNMRGLRATEREYEFIVTLRDSTTKKVVSAMYTDSATRKRFIVLVDKSLKKSDTNRYKKFFPAQTLKLTRIITERDVENDVAGEYLGSRLTDSCWMFKVITGAINVYSDACQQDGQNFDRSSIVAIQFKDGPIVKYNEDNLKEMVGQDINALEAIQDKNLYKAIKKFNRDKEKEAKK